MTKTKKILLFVLFAVIILLLVIILSFNFKQDAPIEKESEIITQEREDVINLPTTHMGIPIEDILNERNYYIVGVNPENYESVEDFVVRNDCMKEKEGLDFINESFVIGLESDEGVLYIPYNLKKEQETFSIKTFKNLAILDIYTACKNDEIAGGKDSDYGLRVTFDWEYKHSKTEELNKILNLETNLYDYVAELKRTPEIGVENTQFLAYLEEFMGYYKDAEETRKEECKKYDCLNNNIEIFMNGYSFYSDGTPASGVKVELLNNTSITTTTDDKGYYELTFTTDKFSYIRLKASKTGFSDAFGKHSINKTDYPFPNTNIFQDFVMNVPQEKIEIRNENYADFVLGKFLVVETEGSKYFVPIDGLYYEDGKQFKGRNLDIYMYQFTKQTDTTYLLENDTFSPVYGYVGNIMKTFGMPYIQFFDVSTGKELFVYSSNPMYLQNQVYHMKELYENYDQIYTAVTPEDMELLYKLSEENEAYPITYDWLIENDFLRWPVRWSLDRKGGVWESVPARLLNTGGLVELPFYSIRDN